MGQVVLRETPAEGVALLQINRPEKRNALNMAVRKAIAEAFQEFAQDDAVRAVVLTGGEDNFAAGADLAEMAERSTVEQMRLRSERYWQVVADCPKPVIAAVNGYALGGGCELAMLADIIVAAEDAVFGQPEIRVGLIPGAGGTQRLTRAVGKYQAMRINLLGESITGAQALTFGLASEVHPARQVIPRALEMASRIAELSPIAAQQIKEVTLAGMDASLQAGLLLERKAFQIMFATEDQKEGAAAFLAKRKPGFKGK
ncbi:MAG: enoyl-CoA hydratase [Methyloligellaceae bacterium]|nr:MAG: enoyl-CoA hydratase [Alphaproteobacteria bacterium]